MTKNWARFPIEEPTGEDLSNFSAYRLYERSAIAGYGVLSGCVTSRSSATAVAVSSGVYTVSGVQATFAGGSLTSITAAATGKQRYDLVYIDGADATLKLCAGVEDTPDVAGDFLENYKPRPAEPTDTDWICLAVIRVTESGIEASNFGTNVYATNSVANLYLSPAFAVDNTTLQVVDGVASVKPAYVKADGTVALSADWDAGSYEVKALKFESDQTTGTAPIAVISTTVCSNLNADLLDGNEAAAFAVAAKGVTNGDSHNHSGGDGASIPTGSTTFTSTARVLGRKTTGGGAGEECTVSEVLGLLGTVEQGDVIYYNGSAFVLLPHGTTAGQVFTTGGHGANPTWTDVSGGYSPLTYLISTDATYIYCHDTDGTELYKEAAASGLATIINALEDTGVRFMIQPGSYALNAQISIGHSAVEIIGISTGVIITAANGINTDMFYINGSGIVRCSLENFILDGNYANQSSGGAIKITTAYSSEDAYHRLTNLFIRNTKGDGVTITGDTRCCRFENVVVTASEAEGLDIAGSDHSFINCIAGTCKTGGFNISSSSSKFSACKAFYCGQTSGSGWYIAGDRCTFISCEVQDCYGNGVMLEGSDSGQYVGLICDSNGTSVDWQSGLIIYNSDNNTIAGGSFFDRQATPTQHYGVHLSGNSTNNVISFASYDRNVTSDYYDESSGANHHITSTPSVWVPISGYTSTPASTSTLTMTTDLTAVIKPGMGLKYVIGGVTYYGLVSAIAANLLTVAGAPLGGDVTSLMWCDSSRVVQVDFFVSGTFADAANTGLLASDMNTKFDWNLGKAYCVLIRHTVKTDDSGANQPRVTISIAGAVVGTSNTNAGEAVAETWTSTVVGINPSNYDINPDEAVEVVTDANGSNDNAEDLTVSAVFVLE